MSSVLEAHELSKVFGGVRAVDQVDLSIQPGEVRALIGPNGSGKTTLINMVSGFYAPSSGRIIFEGQPVNRMRASARVSKGIARTFQHSRLFPSLSVKQNVMIGRHCHSHAGLWPILARSPGMRHEETDIRQQAEKILEFLGLQEVEDQSAGSLPFGKRRLVEIGRALASEPRLMLLDEPAAGMVAQEKSFLTGIIRQLRDRGMSILLVEHDMSVVMGIADIVSVLNFGKKIAEGPPESVQRDERVLEAYLGRHRESQSTCSTFLT